MKDLDTMIVGAGDVLVVRPKRILSVKETLELHQRSKRLFDGTGIRVVVVDHELDLAVVKEEELG